MANTMAMTQPYPVHGNMQPHPGMSHGHPMAQGQPHIGGQAQGMMPGMHGGPQVTQAGPIVTGMPPGAGVVASGGPTQNAHAMAHLGPPPQMFQQPPGMPFQTTMVHQQQMMAQQRQRQHQGAMLQQQPHGGMMTLANGQQYSPAQIAHMRAQNMPMLQLLQQQQQQQLQAQANQSHPQALQQHVHNQQMIAQVHAQQQAQQVALQQRNAAAQHMQMQESQTATSQPPQVPGVPPRPQSAAASQPQAQQPVSQPPTQNAPTPQSQSHTQTPQQQQQQLPPQPGQPSQQQREQQQQTQQQQAQQQHQAQQQAQQQHQTAQQQQQQQQHQQLAQQEAQARQQQHQQQQHQQQQHQQQQHQQQQHQQQQQQQRTTSVNLMMQQPDMHKFMGGQVFLRLLSFIDRLSSPEPHQATKFEFWEEFVAQHFAPGGSLQHQLFNMSDRSDKRFRISYPALAYYYHSHFTSGIKTMTMQAQEATELPLPMGCHAVRFQRCTFTHIFHNDTQVVSTGTLKVNFDANQKIEHLDIGTTQWVEYVPRLSLTPVESPDMKSPKLNKNSKKVQVRPLQTQCVAQPRSMVNSNGITNGVMQNLEIAEALTLMEPLFHYSQNHENLTPAEALNSLVHETTRATQNMPTGLIQGNFHNVGPQGLPGQRTPGMNGTNQFASPAMQSLGLPAQGSPRVGGPAHTPSPAHVHVAGPVAMVHQLSQQGSNLSGSQVASANNSPNVTNKRRRASGIKLEDDAGGEVNGNSAGKVKPSPSIGGKRQKGTA